MTMKPKIDVDMILCHNNYLHSKKVFWFTLVSMNESTKGADASVHWHSVDIYALT